MVKQGTEMKRWKRPIVATMALGLLVSGCGLPGLGGDDDSAGTETTTADNGEVEEPEGGELTDTGGGGIPVPADISINEVARHPGGTAMHVSGITFGSNEIRVAAEFINGATGGVGIRISGGDRLRVVDNLGNEYNYVPPAQLRDRNNIEIEQGGTIGGDFVFAGPVNSEASSMAIVANTLQDNPQTSDMANAFAGESRPVIVLDGIELAW